MGTTFALPPLVPLAAAPGGEWGEGAPAPAALALWRGAVVAALPHPVGGGEGGGDDGLAPFRRMVAATHGWNGADLRRLAREASYGPLREALAAALAGGGGGGGGGEGDCDDVNGAGGDGEPPRYDCDASGGLKRRRREEAGGSAGRVVLGGAPAGCSEASPPHSPAPAPAEWMVRPVTEGDFAAALRVVRPSQAFSDPRLNSGGGGWGAHPPPPPPLWGGTAPQHTPRGGGRAGWQPMHPLSEQGGGPLSARRQLWTHPPPPSPSPGRGGPPGWGGPPSPGRRSADGGARWDSAAWDAPSPPPTETSPPLLPRHPGGWGDGGDAATGVTPPSLAAPRPPHPAHDPVRADLSAQLEGAAAPPSGPRGELSALLARLQGLVDGGGVDDEEAGALAAFLGATYALGAAPPAPGAAPPAPGAQPEGGGDGDG